MSSVKTAQDVEQEIGQAANSYVDQILSSGSLQNDGGIFDNLKSVTQHAHDTVEAGRKKSKKKDGQGALPSIIEQQRVERQGVDPKKAGSSAQSEKAKEKDVNKMSGIETELRGISSAIKGLKVNGEAQSITISNLAKKVDKFEASFKEEMATIGRRFNHLDQIISILEMKVQGKPTPKEMTLPSQNTETINFKGMEVQVGLEDESYKSNQRVINTGQSSTAVPPPFQPAPRQRRFR